MNKWKLLLRQRLQDFLKEFADTCVKCGRCTSDVRIVFATKYLNPQQFVTFLDIAREIDPDLLRFNRSLVGVDISPIIVGENRVQEAQAKFEFVRQTRPELVSSFYPIMIGTLQKNKINKAINIFSEIHSVDSLDLAKALDDRLRKENRVMPIFLEVNVSGEESKHGFRIEELDEAMKTMQQCHNVTIKGLMTMAPFTEDIEEIKGVFRKLKELADRHNLLTSMGMSSDWKEALEEGSDMIRIGGRIFQNIKK